MVLYIFVLYHASQLNRETVFFGDEFPYVHCRWHQKTKSRLFFEYSSKFVPFLKVKIKLKYFMNMKFKLPEYQKSKAIQKELRTPLE